MSNFRRLDEGLYASPQIDLADLAEARAMGVTLVINNRPEGEAPDQTPGPVIEAAAKEAGMRYWAIPITHAGFSEPQIAAMSEALASADGAVLAYCRSGTRSTLLWALAGAKGGRSPDELTRIAAGAGYDLSPIRPMMDMLASQP